jgi:hypothetical protein
MTMYSQVLIQLLDAAVNALAEVEEEVVVSQSTISELIEIVKKYGGEDDVVDFIVSEFT